MPMNYYIAFRACEDFYSKNQRWPIADEDVKHVTQQIVPGILKTFSTTIDGNDLAEKAVREM